MMDKAHTTYFYDKKGGHYILLQSEKVDTTKFVIKKHTLQTFVVKKGHTTSFLLPRQTDINKSH